MAPQDSESGVRMKIGARRHDASAHATVVSWLDMQQLHLHPHPSSPNLGGTRAYSAFSAATLCPPLLPMVLFSAHPEHKESTRTHACLRFLPAVFAVAAWGCAMVRRRHRLFLQLLCWLRHRDAGNTRCWLAARASSSSECASEASLLLRCLHHQALHESLVLLCSKRLGEHVGKLLGCGHPLQLHTSSRYLIGDEVILDVDMLGALTLDAIPGQTLRGLVVAEQDRRVCFAQA